MCRYPATEQPSSAWWFHAANVKGEAGSRVPPRVYAGTRTAAAGGRPQGRLEQVWKLVTRATDGVIGGRSAWRPRVGRLVFGGRT